MSVVVLFVVQKTMFTSAAPGINKTINFQGKMTDDQGLNVAVGTYQFVFRLYTVASGGSATWTETVNLDVVDGIFQHNLGSVAALPGSVDFNTDNIFLGITFNSDPDGEMTPRIQLTATPYAFNSDQLDGLDSSDFVQISPSGAQTGDIAITGSVSAGSLVLSDGSSNTATVEVDSLAGDYVYTIPTTTGHDTFCLEGLANCSGGGGISSIGTLNSQTKSADGAVISGTDLVLQTADASNPGLVSTSAQDFAGAKTFNGAVIAAANGATSTPSLNLSGAWFTGGTATTTKPQLLIQPSAATSNNWSTSGTGLGVNSASGFTGRLVDAQVNGSRRFAVNSDGGLSLGNTSNTQLATIQAYGAFGSSHLSFQANGVNDVIAEFRDCCNYVFQVKGTGTPSFFNYGLDVNGVLSTNTIRSLSGNIVLGQSDTTGTLLVLDTKTNAGDPTGVNGGMYYNSNANAFRIYENGTWRNIGTGNGDILQGGNSFTSAMTIGTNDAYALNFVTGGTGRFSIADNAATLTGWGLTTINSNDSIVIRSNGVPGTTVDIDSGSTGGVYIASSTGSSKSVYLSAPGAFIRSTYVGSSFSTSTTTIQGGSGGILLQPTGANVVIGTSDTTGTLLVLDTKTDSGDPTGVNGGMYYNSDAGKFRCYEAGSWANCIGAGGGGISSLNGQTGTTQTFANDTNITISSNTDVHTLGWAGTLSIARGGTGASDAAGALTNLGATTLGANLITLTNPSAVRFLRVNVDNTVSARTAAELLADISGVPASRTISTNNGLTGGGDLTADRTLGLTGQALALHNLNTNGIIVRTGAGTVVGRTITAGSGVTVTNGDGVAGNPTVALNTAVTDGLYVLKAGDTMTGKLVLPASTTSFASINMPHGAAPTSPVNGDMWTTTASLLIRLNGTSRSVWHSGNMAAIDQVEAEAGSSTTVRAWTAQRVNQAIQALAPVQTAGTGLTLTGTAMSLTATGAGAAFVQGGNSFGAAAVLGTNDNFALSFETNSTTRWNISTAGHLLPQANDTYDIGSDTARVKDLWLGGDTIHIGTSTTDEGVISYDTANNILNFGTDSTSNGDIAFFGNQLYLGKSAGNIGIGTTPFSANDKLSVQATFHNSSGNSSVIKAVGNVNVASSDIVYNLHNTVNMYHTSGAHVGVVGQQIQLNFMGNGGSTAHGSYFSGWSVLNSGHSVTNLYGLDIASPLVNSGASLTNWMGVRVGNPGNSGTLTNNYGLYVANQTAGTSNYGLYIDGASTRSLHVDSGTSYFADAVGVGTAPGTVPGIKIGGYNTAANYGLWLEPTTHPTSNRAAVRVDDWIIGQDMAQSGTKDFFIHQIATGSFRLSISTAGVVNVGGLTVGGNTAWHAGNDGAGSGLDADLLDGISSGSFLQNASGSGLTIATTGSGGPNVLGVGGGAAMLSFHRPSAYAVNFGLDTDNILKVGGWSMGAVARRVILGDGASNGGNLVMAGNGTFSNTAVGNITACGATWAGFRNSSLATDCASYGLIQSNAGQTLINAASGQNVEIRVNNVNSLTIGNTGITAAVPVVSTYFGYSNATAAGGTNVCRSAVNGFGWFQVGHCSSLAQYKDNVTNLPYGLETLRQLRPVQYKWNIDSMDWDTGFIAEEVHAVAPIFSEYSNGQLSGVNYAHLTSLLAQSTKQLDVQVQTSDVRLSVVELSIQSIAIDVANLASSSSVQTLAASVTARLDTLEQGIFTSLTVSGPAVFNSTLTVTGDTFVQNITVAGKIITAGATPLAEVLGTSTVDKTIGLTGNDTAGELSLVLGGSASVAAGEQLFIEFANAYGAKPRVNLTPVSAAAAGVRYHVEPTLTGFTLYFTDPPTIGQTYSFNYFIVQ